MINLRIVLFFIGILITSLGITMILPLLVEMKTSGINTSNFFISTLITLFFGITLILAFNKEEKEVNVKDTILITTLSWPIMIILSSLPFYLDTNCQHFVDAIFEATSGLTTTGATIHKQSYLYLILVELNYLHKIGVRNLKNYTTDLKKLLNY